MASQLLPESGFWTQTPEWRHLVGVLSVKYGNAKVKFMKIIQQKDSHLWLIFSFIVMILFTGETCWASTLYVDVDAVGSNDGSSWVNAFTDLQSALTTANWGDEIWVAQGIYKPTSGTDRNIPFVMTEGVTIYGGFTGYETDLTQRYWETNETILSGDIGTVRNASDNSYLVVLGGRMTTLNGFTVTDGGRGMHIEDVSPTVANCIFTDNYGEGMYNISSAPIVENCTFSDNWASNGGGMSNTNGSSPTVTNCTFKENSSNYGGGMYNHDSSPTVKNCTFSDNWAFFGGGGMLNFNSSPSVANCTFSINSADHLGGGIYNDSSSLMMANCTFSGNRAIIGGGMYLGSGSVTNCIFWKNINPSEYDEVYNTSTDLTFYHCAINGSGGSGDQWDTSLGTDGGGNIMTDPQFVDSENPSGPDGIWMTADDGLALSKASPCIDAGNPASLSETDILGNPRARTIDMGAYEFQGSDPQNGVVSWVFYK